MGQEKEPAFRPPITAERNAAQHSQNFQLPYIFLHPSTPPPVSFSLSTDLLMSLRPVRYADLFPAVSF
jgi:hypothetical protein